MKIDINDLNYHGFNEGIKLSYNKERYKINILKILSSLINIIIKGFGSIGYFFVKRYESPKLDCNIALFAFSENNNKRSLEPLMTYLPDALLFTVENLTLKRVWFYAMLYSPIVLYRCFRYKGKSKEFYCYYFTAFCKSYGTYIEAVKILRKLKPKLVVVSNDHSYTSRCFFRAAQYLDIKTAYLQHASVNKFFPPLEFDYAFLDGMESYEKYADGKYCNATVFLSGNPRFDMIAKVKNADLCEQVQSIGIAVNPSDRLDHIERLITLIKNEIPEMVVTIRPHPSSDMKFWVQRAIDWKCVFSNAYMENPFIFIHNNELFISGDSSFHLDVAMSGRLSFYYNFSDRIPRDAYGYIKNELILDISNDPIYHIKNALNKLSKKNIDQKAQYYVGNYNTKYWERSAELISGTILNLLNDSLEMKNWKISPIKNVFLINEDS